VQLQKGLHPTTDIGGGRPASKESGMLVLLHDLLLSPEIAEGGLWTYSVSQKRKKFLKLFYGEKMRWFSLKSATVVVATIPDHFPTDSRLVPD
jgi:hypothetical protein